MNKKIDENFNSCLCTFTDLDNKPKKEKGAAQTERDKVNGRHRCF